MSSAKLKLGIVLPPMPTVPSWSPRDYLHVVGMLRFMSFSKPAELAHTFLYSLLVSVSVSMALSTVIVIYALTARVAGAPQMISKPVSSIFPVLHCLWDVPNFRPVHFLMLSSHLLLCLPCLLSPFTVPCKIVLTRPNEREKCPYHCNLCLFTMVRRSSCDSIACWVLSRTSSLEAWSLYEIRSSLW